MKLSEHPRQYGIATSCVAIGKDKLLYVCFPFVRTELFIDERATTHTKEENHRANSIMKVFHADNKGKWTVMCVRVCWKGSENSM